MFTTILVSLLLLASTASASSEWPITPQDCFAANIYHEARGEPLIGQYLVGQVVLNRVHSTKYPNDVCSVIKQNRQFSWVHEVKNRYPTDKYAWERAKSITKKFLLGKVELDLSEGAIFYHASYMTPWWAKNKTFIIEVAGHKFYR